jgi:hypothetical protein
VGEGLKTPAKASETKKPPEGGLVRFAGSAPVTNGERHMPFGLSA